MQFSNDTAGGVAPGFSQPLDITFNSRGERLIGLGARNGLLRVLSLGLYTFWAKTDVRRKLWSFTRINGEPLEYTGTGKELFQGFLIVFGTVILPVMLCGFAIALFSSNDKALLGLYQIAIYGVFFLLLGNALYRAQRYRLSRTRWRGIRGALTGSPGRYGWTYFWTVVLPFAVVGILATILSFLGLAGLAVGVAGIGVILALWIFPWRANLLQAHLIRDMYFGDRKLTYTGTSGPLYKNYLFAWAGTALLLIAAFYELGRILFREGVATQWTAAKIPPTPSQIAELLLIPIVTIIAWALITAWYRAAQTRHFASHTHFEGATFRSDVSGKGMMWLTLSNWIISILGFLFAVVIAGASIYALGLMPEPPETAGATPDPGVLPVILVLATLVFFTTLTSTFAQFRSARYFMSRLKLDGGVNLGAIMQSGETEPKRGEGLAQMFEIDAF